jgi:hypothetical protein
MITRICVALLFVVTGCSEQQRQQLQQLQEQRRGIAGEIFTRARLSYGLKGEVIKQGGSAVHFLTSSERDMFESLLKEWRDQMYKNEYENWNKAYKDYTALVDKYKGTDGEVHDEAVVKQLNSMASDAKHAKSMIEEKRYDDQISFNYDPIKKFLTSVHHTVADSEGRFNVILALGKEYWIVAEAETSGTQWYFRYVPDGTKLVLSEDSH